MVDWDLKEQEGVTESEDYALAQLRLWDGGWAQLLREVSDIDVQWSSYRSEIPLDGRGHQGWGGDFEEASRCFISDMDDLFDDDDDFGQFHHTDPGDSGVYEIEGPIAIFHTVAKRSVILRRIVPDPRARVIRRDRGPEAWNERRSHVSEEKTHYRVTILSDGGVVSASWFNSIFPALARFRAEIEKLVHGIGACKDETIDPPLLDAWDFIDGPDDDGEGMEDDGEVGDEEVGDQEEAAPSSLGSRTSSGASLPPAALSGVSIIPPEMLAELKEGNRVYREMKATGTGTPWTPEDDSYIQHWLVMGEDGTGIGIWNISRDVGRTEVEVVERMKHLGWDVEERQDEFDQTEHIFTRKPGFDPGVPTVQ